MGTVSTELQQQQMPLASQTVRTLVVSLLLVTSLYSTSVHSLSCSSCELTTCPVLIDCPYGLVKDPCNCCAICAQGEGQVCGGKYDLEGVCGVEYYCDKKFDVGDILLQSSAIGSCKGKSDYASTVHVYVYIYVHY